jgi:phosphate transport system protein
VSIVEKGCRYFEEELTSLESRLLEMGALVEERVCSSVEGLAARDLEIIGKVLRGDAPVNDLHIEIDSRCCRLLALYQPLATDLRAVVSVLKINSDLERVGDLAVNIAEAALRYVIQPPLKEPVDVPTIAEVAQGMLHSALDAFVRRDIRGAQQVLNQDDQLDGLKSQVFRDLLTAMIHEPSTVGPALDLILISRHLERIGDHATNIAEDIIFMVSAQDVRHHHLQPAPAPVSPRFRVVGRGSSHG